VVNIIGFDVDNVGQQALKQVADAGGGTYTTVQSKEELEEHLRQERERLKNEWENTPPFFRYAPLNLAIFQL
jgi:Ca-activated chloride channel homolog